MLILESLVDGLVEVTVVNLIGLETGQRGSDLGQLAAQVDALLVRTLGGRREGGELCVDLGEEFRQFAVVEGAGVVLVVLFEEEVETAEVVRGLREALLHAAGDVSPFGEGEVHFLWISALLPGDGA